MSAVDNIDSEVVEVELEEVEWKVLGLFEPLYSLQEAWKVLSVQKYDLVVVVAVVVDFLLIHYYCYW
jgi:hypothetical protein